MKTTRKASRLIGIALGRTWRGWLRLESWFSSLIKKIGIPVIATKIVLRLLLAAGIVKLMYVSGFLTLLGAFLAVGVLIVVLAFILNNWTPSNSREESEERLTPGDVEDHKQSIHYHPMNYCDDPDPRFED